MTAVIPDPKRTRHFRSARAFEAWLAKHHARASELFLRIYKKDSGVSSVTHAQALEVALCWGWIDGIRKSFDELSFLQRFTPRKAKSAWSQVNCKHVERLLVEGRMQPPGLKQIEAAKADGRWAAAYAPPSKMSLPPDLVAAIESAPRALATFRTLNRQNTYALGYRLQKIQSVDRRRAKIQSFVEMLERGETLHPLSARSPRARLGTGGARGKVAISAGRPKPRRS